MRNSIIAAGPGRHGGSQLDTRLRATNAEVMEVHFVPDPDQEAFIRQGIANGRYQTAEDAVRDAMSRWEERERTRLELLATLDEAEADLETGRYTDYSNGTLPLLADELKREARPLRLIASGTDDLP